MPKSVELIKYSDAATIYRTMAFQGMAMCNAKMTCFKTLGFNIEQIIAMNDIVVYNALTEQ